MGADIKQLPWEAKPTSKCPPKRTVCTLVCAYTIHLRGTRGVIFKNIQGKKYVRENKINTMVTAFAEIIL